MTVRKVRCTHNDDISKCSDCWPEFSGDTDLNTPLATGGELEKRRIIDDLVDFDEPDSSMVSGWGYSYEKAADYVLALIAKRERAARLDELTRIEHPWFPEYVESRIKALEQEGK